MTPVRSLSAPPAAARPLVAYVPAKPVAVLAGVIAAKPVALSVPAAPALSPRPPAPREVAAAPIYRSVADLPPRPTEAQWEAYHYELLRQAVEIPTVAGRGEVPRLVALIRRELLLAGFPESAIEVTDVGETQAMTVRIAGTGARRPVLLNAHFDVVEADAADWDGRSPFELKRSGEFLYGRGVADNKLGLTSLIVTFMRLQHEGIVPNRDIVLVLTGDEETSMASTRVLAERFRGAAAMMLSTDDVSMALDKAGKVVAFFFQTAEKPYATFELRVRNEGGHSSRPTASNAIYELAQALVALERHPLPIESNESTREYFRAMAERLEDGPLARAMRRFAEDPADVEAARVLAADPEYVGQIRTTCVPTLLHAGHAENALPQSAVATLNARLFPGTTVAQMMEYIATTIANPAIEIVHINADSTVVADASTPTPELMQALRVAVDANAPGTRIIPTMGAGASDGGHFRAAGVPSFIASDLSLCPADDFMHASGERIPANSLGKSQRHWLALIKALCLEASST